MIHVAVIDDSREDREALTELIRRYGREHGVELSVTQFENGTTFIVNYTASFDLIFLDIMMPNTNGMAVAEELRKVDKSTKLIFVSNMAKFAVKGYEMDAMGYMLKPINYADVESKLNKAIALIETAERELVIKPMGGGVQKISVKSIFYVEVTGHKVIYHFKNTEIAVHGVLSKIEEELSADGFLRCNNCYLVNPRYIQSVEGYDIKMTNGDLLRISHPRKKKFMEELAAWLGKGNIV